MSDAKNAFMTTMNKAIDTSVKRMELLNTGRVNGRLDTGELVIREAMILMDKLHLAFPNEYGKLMAEHKLGDLKNGRGYCANPSCYNHIRTADAPTGDSTLEPFLDSHCIECSTEFAKEMEILDQMRMDSYDNPQNS